MFRYLFILFVHLFLAGLLLHNGSTLSKKLSPAPWGLISYPLTPEPIDVVIPCAPKDIATLNLCIQGIKAYGENVRRVIVLSKECLTNEAEWFPEEAFPFHKESVALEIYSGNQAAADQYLAAPATRIGWILQQLLKLYAPFIIPGISSNVLVLDSDVIFLKPTSFMTTEGFPLFTPAIERTSEYFRHASRLLPGLRRVHPNHSGIAHHMLFQRPILEDLFDLIEKKHREEPWKAICHVIAPEKVYFSPFSEYEIYFNFALLRTQQAKIRPLQWVNASDASDLSSFEGLSYIALHDWLRKKDL